MALREIVLETDPVLRKTTRPVDVITDHVKRMLDDMAESMYEANGVGLAAPQISVRRKIVVIDIGDGLIEMINPEILEEKGTQRNMEGCLSVPGKNGYVDRPMFVKVKAQNRDGEWITYDAEGYLAIAMCHEIDHLNGILFIDKVLELTDEEIEELRRRDMAEYITLETDEMSEESSTIQEEKEA